MSWMNKGQAKLESSLGLEPWPAWGSIGLLHLQVLLGHVECLQDSIRRYPKLILAIPALEGSTTHVRQLAPTLRKRTGASHRGQCCTSWQLGETLCNMPPSTRYRVSALRLRARPSGSVELNSW